MKGNGLKRYRLRFNQHYRLWLAGGLLFFCACAWGQPSPVGGTLGAVGSDTMAGLMLRWGEALHHRYPDITLQFQASGSASAPTALVAGTTRFGPMSRPMTESERQNSRQSSRARLQSACKLCSKCLRVDRANVKALYRRALSLSSPPFHEYARALADVQRAIEVDGAAGNNNKELARLRQRLGG